MVFTSLNLQSISIVVSGLIFFVCNLNYNSYPLLLADSLIIENQNYL